MAASTLPMDIIVEEVLPRLPARSLLRFKCVSKFFKSLISTSEFADLHLRHTLSSDASRLLILIGEEASDLYTFHFDLPKVPAVNLRFPRIIGDDLLFLAGSSNGLACVCMSFCSLVIFNPSTGIYRKIKSENTSPLDSYTSFGFGFDDINHDYKIIRVRHPDLDDDYDLDDLDDYVGVKREVQVYSLNSDSWSLVETTYGEELMEPMEKSTVIDNHLVHWKFWNPSNREHRIGCFDLRNNQWGADVPLPDYCSKGRFIYRNKQRELVHLGVLDGYLCLLTRCFRSREVDVWVMTKYGVKDSWVKLAKISESNAWDWLKISPFVYGKGSRSEKGMGEDLQSKLAEMLRWVEINGAPPYSDACMCVGSLISIPGGASCEIQALRNQEQQRMQV